MKRFWLFQLFCSILLLLIFIISLYWGITNDTISLIFTSNMIMYGAIIHFAVCVVISIIKIKKQTFWTLLFLVFIGTLCVAEFFSFYGFLAGMLGDT